MIGSEANAMLGLGTIRCKRIALIARHDIANISSELARGAGDQRGPLRHEAFSAECSPHEGVDDAHLRRDRCPSLPPPPCASSTTNWLGSCVVSSSPDQDAVVE